MACVINSMCNIDKCVEEVNGLESKSASPSDTWVLTLKDNTQFREGSTLINIKNCFIKYYIAPESWFKNVKRLGLINDKNQEHLVKILNSLYALDYEAKVYKEIIMPLIEKKVSPHFIRCYSCAENCSYFDLLTTLQEANIETEDAKEQLERNILYMFYHIKNRPSINEEVTQTQLDLFNGKDDPKFIDMEFNYIVNQSINPDNTDTLANMLNKRLLNLNDLFIILFQLTQACMVMERNGLAHNDLHHGNIWITKRDDQKVNTRYIINENKEYSGIDQNVFIFKNLNICCRIYDFDRSYSTKLGKNENLTAYLVSLGQENKIIPQKDIMKIFCYICKQVNEEVLGKIMKCFTNNPNFWIKNFNEIEKCFLPYQEIKHVYSYEQILEKLYDVYLTNYVLFNLEGNIEELERLKLITYQKFQQIPDSDLITYKC